MDSTKVNPILESTISLNDCKYDNKWIISTLDELPRLLVSCCPCVIHVTNMDAVIQYDQPSSDEMQQAQPEDLKHVYQEKLQSALEKIMTLLGELLNKESTSNSSALTEPNLVTLVVSSRLYDQLTYTMQSYFPTKLILQSEDPSSQSKFSSSYCGLTIKKSVLEMLKSVIESSGWSFLSSLSSTSSSSSSSTSSDLVNVDHLSHPAKMLLHAAIYCAFERCYYHERATSQVFNRKLVVHRRDLRKVLDQFQSYLQSNSSKINQQKGKGKKSNDASSSKVTPVHWADIGGLERLVEF